MEKEENFDPQQGLHIINSMISTAKNKLADDGFLLIFWGWLVAASAMIHFITIQMNIEMGYLVWPVLMPLGGVVSAVYGYKKKKKSQVRTYVDNYLGYLWTGFGIAMILTLGLGPLHGIKRTYFFLMILYGMATFVSGGLLNFKPLIFGSCISFACAVLSVFLGEVDQLWCIALALLGSYIIPGHMLRSKYRTQEHV